MAEGWDVHCHVIPSAVIEAAERREHDMEIRDGWLHVAEESLPLGALTRTHLLVENLDERGLTGAVVSVPPAFYRYDLNGERARTWTRLLNDSLAAELATAPARLRGLLHLPLGDRRVAEEELDRCEGPPWVGSVMGNPPGAGWLGAPMRELLSVLDRRLPFVFFHPGACADPRLSDLYLSNTLGYPYETGFALGTILQSGLLDAYPSLRMCFAHGGGVAGALVPRWVRSRQTSRPGVPVDVDPAAQARRVYVDSVVHDERLLQYVRDVFGPQHVVLGTDWPFPMGTWEQDAATGPQQAALAANTREMIPGLDAVAREEIHDERV